MRTKVGFGIFATRSYCAFAANAYGERFANFARKSHGALAVNAHFVRFENFTRRSHCAFTANTHGACVAKFTCAFAVNAYDVRLCELRHKVALRICSECVWGSFGELR